MANGTTWVAHKDKVEGKEKEWEERLSTRHIPRAPALLQLCKTEMRLDSLHRTSVYSYFTLTNSYSSAHAVSLAPHERKLTRGGTHTGHAFIFITRLHPGPYVVVNLRTSVGEVSCAVQKILT